MNTSEFKRLVNLLRETGPIPAADTNKTMSANDLRKDLIIKAKEVLTNSGKLSQQEIKQLVDLLDTAFSAATRPGTDIGSALKRTTTTLKNSIPKK